MSVHETVFSDGRRFDFVIKDCLILNSGSLSCGLRSRWVEWIKTEYPIVTFPDQIDENEITLYYFPFIRSFNCDSYQHNGVPFQQKPSQSCRDLLVRHQVTCVTFPFPCRSSNYGTSRRPCQLLSLASPKSVYVLANSVVPRYSGGVSQSRRIQ